MMNRSNKLVAAGLGSALALAVATPSLADGRHVGAVVGGFAAGAIVGSAAANAYAYGPGYAYYPRYSYGPGYAYDAYAYAPGSYAYAPVYGFDYPVDDHPGTGAPIYRSELGPNCTVGLREQDRC
jgi:hypothetical protein